MNINSLYWKMSRPRDHKKLGKIINATRTIFLRKGMQGLKIADVAKEAGLATGTVYIYFNNKSTLIDRMYQSINESVADAIKRGYDNNESFLTAFRQIWRNYLNYCLKNPEEIWLLKHQYNQPEFSDDDLVFKPIETLLDRGKSQGLVAPVPTKLLTAQLIGGIHEIASWHHSGQLLLDSKGFDNAYKMSWNSIRR